MMTVLFVRPRPSPETIGLQHVMIVEPLELELLGAVTPPHRPVIVDMILEKKPFAHFLRLYRPDVVCVTGYITHVGVMIGYCARAKKFNPAIITVAGGVHCEVCPGHLDHPSVDFRVVRNAPVVFGRLLDHLYRGNELPRGVLKRGEQTSDAGLPSFDFTVPFPDRSLTRAYRRRYFYIFHDRVALLKTAFGCPHRCRFCFCRAVTRGRYAARPLAEVMEELLSIQERNVYIVDDDFFASKDRLVSFIGELNKRGIRKEYLVYGRADFIASEPAVVERFRDAGLRTVIVGFESFFDEELARYGKGTDGEVNREAMRVLRRLNVDCYATMIATPNWDHARFSECASILRSLGIHYVNIQPLTPLPGTELEIPESDRLLRADEYEKWDLAHVSVRPTAMSVAEFYRQIVKTYDAVLFRPPVLAGYLRRYSPSQLWKMASGSFRVRRQYLRKIREARRLESSPGAKNAVIRCPNCC